jgi:hypothetical protein
MQCTSFEIAPAGIRWPADTVRLVVQEGGRCDVVLAPQPFLVALYKSRKVYQSRDCPSAEELEIEDPLVGKNMLNEEEEQLLEYFNDIALRLLLSSRVKGNWTEPYRQIYLDAVLDLMSTSEVEAAPEAEEPAKNRLKVKLYLGGKVLPTGKLDRTELRSRLMDAWEKMQTSNATNQTKLLALSPSSRTAPIMFTGPPHYHEFSYDYSERAACIRHLYKRNQLFARKRCSAVLQVAQEKGRELEIRWDFPLAAMVRWIYVMFCVLALCYLSSDVGQRETSKERRRRQFRQIVQDPLLREGIKRDAMKQFNGDEQEVAKYMAEQDARAARFEADEADLGWKRSEAKLEAWNQRLHCLWAIRIALAVAFLLSCGLLVIDKPKAGVVMDGAILIVLTFGLTYVCLPKSPTQQAKKGVKSELEEPLLEPATKGCP